MSYSVDVLDTYWMARYKDEDGSYTYKTQTDGAASPRLYKSKGQAKAAGGPHCEAVEVQLVIKPKGCPNKIDGVCQMPNVHCGYPKCVE